MENSRPGALLIPLIAEKKSALAHETGERGPTRLRVTGRGWKSVAGPRGGKDSVMI